MLRKNPNPENPIRLAVLQRVCTAYRVPLFAQLSATAEIEMTLFIGDDLPNSKIKSGSDLSSVNVRKLKTRFIRFGSRVLPWHVGLVAELRKLKPDVILCEGESHFLGYMQAIWYRRRHKDVVLVHWSLGGLPGVLVRPRSIGSRCKYFFQKRFGVFLAYSSFGKECLIELGHAPDKILVATNVADTRGYLEKAAQMHESPSEARAKLGLPDRFTVLYVGAMDVNKRPDLFLDLAQATDPEHFNFLLLGDGAMLKGLRSRAKTEGLINVFLPGRVSDKLPLYYRASDAMVLPGRGGMVISEAMAWSLPVIVYEADGTEYDLIRDAETGLRLAGNTVTDFKNALETLRTDMTQCKPMGSAGRERLVKKYNFEQMVGHILKAVRNTTQAEKP